MEEQTYTIQGYDGSEIAALLEKIDNLGPATNQAAGTMSASDKGKLDDIESGAEENVIESISLGSTELTPTGKNVTIPVDNTPTTGSNNLVKSGGVAVELAKKYVKPQGGIPASDLAAGVLPASGVPGVAEGIADSISPGTAQEFTYRQSGGDGVNYMKRIKGNTIVSGNALLSNDATAIETKGENNAWTRRIEICLDSFQVKNTQGVVSTITGGLKSTGTVYDEIIDGSRYRKKVLAVDLGSLTYDYVTSGHWSGYSNFFRAQVTGMPNSSSGICARYTVAEESFENILSLTPSW